MSEERRLYAERDVIALGDYYIRHVSAMTSEGLHFKSDIAAELAWRDAEIDRLKAARTTNGIDRAIEVVRREGMFCKSMQERGPGLSDTTKHWGVREMQCSEILKKLHTLSPKPPADDTGLVEALAPFAKWAQWELDHHLPRAIAEDDSTPVAGGNEYRDEPTIEVGDLKRLRAALTAHQENPND